MLRAGRSSSVEPQRGGAVTASQIGELSGVLLVELEVPERVAQTRPPGTRCGWARSPASSRGRRRTRSTPTCGTARCISAESPSRSVVSAVGRSSTPARPQPGSARCGRCGSPSPWRNGNPLLLDRAHPLNQGDFAARESTRTRDTASTGACPIVSLGQPTRTTREGDPDGHNTFPSPPRRSSPPRPGSFPNLAPAGPDVYIPVNSMVIRGAEPVIVDTGAPVHRDAVAGEGVLASSSPRTCGGSSCPTTTATTPAVSSTSWSGARKRRSSRTSSRSSGSRSRSRRSHSTACAGSSPAEASMPETAHCTCSSRRSSTARRRGASTTRLPPPCGSSTRSRA